MINDENYIKDKMIAKLKRERLLQEKSQYYLEKETGISQSLISLFERRYREPNSRQKELLSQALGVKTDWLFPDDNEEDPNGLRYETKRVGLKEK